MRDYHINIFFSEEDDWYVADVPDLVFCSALGDSPEHALTEVRIATENWLAAARQRGEQVPQPKYRPFIHQPL